MIVPSDPPDKPRSPREEKGKSPREVSSESPRAKKGRSPREDIRKGKKQAAPHVGTEYREFKLRMSDEDNELLNQLSERKGRTRSLTLHFALAQYQKFLDKQRSKQT